MNKFLLGVVAGAAAAYMCNKKMDKASMDKMCNSANEFFDKAKQKVKDTFDKGKNEAEYLADRVDNKVNG